MPYFYGKILIVAPPFGLVAHIIHSALSKVACDPSAITGCI